MPVLRDESLLKLFFADALPREQALEQLRMRRIQGTRGSSRSSARSSSARRKALSSSASC